MPVCNYGRTILREPWRGIDTNPKNYHRNNPPFRIDRDIDSSFKSEYLYPASDKVNLHSKELTLCKLSDSIIYKVVIRRD